MTDRDALLAAITANPDEDTPRLVYADWLQEHGEDDRAEFIRVQCRLHHMVHGEKGWDRLLKREKELRVKLFGALLAAGFADLTFSRGFVGTVESGALDFRDRAHLLTPEVAPAFEFTLRDSSEDERDDALWEADYERYASTVDEVMRRPELLRCVSLNLPCLGIRPTARILQSLQLTNLRRLNFPSSEAGPALHAIASKTFANLRWLNVSQSNSASGPASLHPFTGSEYLENLEYLDFSSNRVYGDALQSLSESARAPKLRYLNVSHGDFRDFEVSYFLFVNRSKKMPALAELDLSGSGNDLVDLSKAAEEPDEDERDRAPYFGRLTKLWLRDCKITDKGAKVLVAYPSEVKLELLDLRGNPIGAAGKRAIRKRFGKGVCMFDEGN